MPNRRKASRGKERSPVQAAGERDNGGGYCFISGAPVCQDLPQIPPKVEYSLTERGRSLVAVLDRLCDRGMENRR
ncbi:MAG: winged helix-turn-helix transcriptional regulator [Oscillospiraceae bacterium]|nr:winged helix-turn-helix transcriptional regulator [Oscillospiraceae bacterium]